MTIKDNIPMLLGINNKKMSTERIVDRISEWSNEEIKDAVDSVERRYEKRTSQKMSNYTGLVVFTEMIKMLRESEVKTYNIKKAIEACQEKVLMYHQKYEEVDKKE